MQAELDERRRRPVSRRSQQLDHGVGRRGADRPGSPSTPGRVIMPRCGPRMPRADRLVVGVEEIFVGRIEHAVVRARAAQHEGLEEPRRVRQVPLGRTGVGHRLDRLVLGRQRHRPAARSGRERPEMLDAIGAACVRARHALSGWTRHLRTVATAGDDSRLQCSGRALTVHSLSRPPRDASADLRDRPVAHSIFRECRLPRRRFHSD